MKHTRSILAISLAAAACLALTASPANAAFGLNNFDVTFEAQGGKPATQAGSHPFAMTTSFGLNFTGEDTDAQPDGELKNGFFEQLPGFVGDATAYPRCSNADFLVKPPLCALETQVGVATVTLESPTTSETVPVYNLVPPPGAPARLGFAVAGGVPVVIDVGIKPSPPYSLLASVRNTYQILKVFHSSLTIWGVPADPAHDAARGGPSEISPPRPFLTLPRSCRGPQPSSYLAESWEGDTDAGSVLSHDFSEPPAPLGFDGCAKIAFGFNPTIDAAPTTRAAQSPSGLDFSLDVEEEVEGLKDPDGLARSDVREALVTLPEGMTANPSLAEGLEVCTKAQLARETPFSAPGAGCPEAAKIGSLEVQSPLVAESLGGSLYVAKPFDNLADDSLIALYFVIKNPKLGIVIRQPAKVTPDPETGQLITAVKDIPQLPFSHFRLKFREGGRSPLASPPGCGSFDVKAEITPHSGADPVTTTSTFRIVSGPDNGPCPSGGTPPFEPGFSAGTLNNNAASHSPFNMRLTRRDGDQDLTRFDAILPPGVVARLAGVSWCPEAAIAAAKAKTGRQELASPSCPANSRIGSVLAGAGVGSQLTYVPGSVYLAGPLGSAPLSVVGVVPAVAGPFDVGTVVTRQALVLDPITAEVRVDGALSDPIPHILAGIPLAVRDIRVAVDRPNFTLNPTNCNPMATFAGIWGGGSHVFSTADDFPVLRSARFQAANCANLGFRPRLGIQLRGGTKRGAHPALRAVVTPRPGEANFSRAVVTLPRSAFLDQAHIRTICTRVQFHAPPGHGAHCPPGARYGFARAWSPLLAAPLQGPVFLRSSDNNLPDLVVALRGLVDIELAARIDSVRGGIRSTFTGIPDAPVSRFILDMQGGKKGLIVNSRNLCVKPKRNRARANLRGQNGKLSRTRPVVRAVKCKKRRRARRSSHSRVSKVARLARSSRVR